MARRGQLAALVAALVVFAPGVLPAVQAPAPATPPATGANLLQLKLPPNPKVMVIPANDGESTRYGMIDPWEAGFVGRRLREARREQYDLVILEIDTHGGWIASCEKINRDIADCGLPVVAYIRGDAFSGGALISMGCTAIAMEPGTNIGGAQAVSLFGDLGMDERMKAGSFLVALARGLSEKHGFPAAIAQGMVDSAVAVYETDSPTQRFITDTELADWKANEATRGPAPKTLSTWKEKDQILTLTAGRAYDCGMAAALPADREALFRSMGVRPASVTEAGITVSEKAGRFLGHPVWLVLLVLVGLIALVYELKAGGHGMGYLVFIFCGVLFFWLAFLADSAGALELLLFLAGAILLAVELFVLPGFGVAGFAAVVLLLLSLVLAFIPEGSLPNLWKEPGSSDPFQAQLLIQGLTWAAVTLFSIVGLVLAALLSGVKLPGVGRLALHSSVRASPGTPPASGVAGEKAWAAAAPPPSPPPVASELASLVGQEGVTETVLRPAGKVRLGGVTYEAVTEGGWIEPGRRVRVMEARSTGLVVRSL